MTDLRYLAAVARRMTAREWLDGAGAMAALSVMALAVMVMP